MAEQELVLNGDTNLRYSRLAESSNSLSVGQPQQNDVRKKVPRRILHFSDGILEEYSTDEEDVTDNARPAQQTVDPSTLPWLPWCWHHTKSVASRSLAVADYCGEKLAYAFGITSPKYQYALDEYNRQLAEEEEERRCEEREVEASRQRHLATVTMTTEQTNVPAGIVSSMDAAHCKL